MGPFDLNSNADKKTEAVVWMCSAAAADELDLQCLLMKPLPDKGNATKMDDTNLQELLRQY